MQQAQFFFYEQPLYWPFAIRGNKALSFHAINVTILLQSASLVRDEKDCPGSRRIFHLRPSASAPSGEGSMVRWEPNVD